MRRETRVVHGYRRSFLVAGEGKRAMLDQVLSGGSHVPAARLRPDGELLWFVDRAAAGRWAG